MSGIQQQTAAIQKKSNAIQQKSNAIQQKENKLFAKISAYRTLVDNYPKLSNNNSNKSKLQDFIISLFKALAGIEELFNSINKIIINELDAIENNIKDILNRSIKENISCNIDPSLLDTLFTDGIYLSVKDVDLFGLMKINPTSSIGKLLYFDTANTFKSSDFNTFLWNVITTPSSLLTDSEANWNDIITVRFYENITYNNKLLYNVINIKLNTKYKNLPLSQFNSDYINSIKIFNKKTVIAKIFDNIFGSISFNLNKTQNEILLEEEINQIINNISELEDNQEIDDSYFTFSNDQYNELLRISELKRIGAYSYTGTSIGGINLPLSTITSSLYDMTDDATLVQQNNIFNTIIDQSVTALIESDPNNNISDNDIYNLKLNIITNIVKEFTLIATSSFMSPKIYILLVMNNQMLGINTPNTAIDYLSQNKKFISSIVKGIMNIIIEALMADLLIYVGKLVKKVIIKKAKEKKKLHEQYMETLTAFNEMEKLSQDYMKTIT